MKSVAAGESNTILIFSVRIRVYYLVRYVSSCVCVFFQKIINSDSTVKNYVRRLNEEIVHTFHDINPHVKFFDRGIAIDK